MDLGLSGRVAMVAASSKGLGKACALSLAKEGCRLSLCAREEQTLKEAKEEILQNTPTSEILTECVDVSTTKDLDRWVSKTKEHFGQIDILVSNTGGPPAASFLSLSEEQWKDGIESTLMNVIRLCRLVIPDMKARNFGRIIHITSYVAKEPESDLTISSTLRAGISSLTRNLGRELAKNGITVNAVLPGHVLTGRQYHLAEIRGKALQLSQEAYLEKAAAEIPMKRMGSPEEIGDVVTFLASSRASYLTGVSLPVDGGILRAGM